MSVLTYKRGDLAPDTILTLYNADNTVVDLTGASSVKLIAKQIITGSIPATINRSLSIVDAANGKVKFTPVSGDTTTVGAYNFESQVTWADGRPQTFPNGGDSTNIYDTMNIVQDLGD